MRWSRAAGPMAGLCVGVGVVAFVLDGLFPFPFERLSRATTRVVLDREGVPLRHFLPEDGIDRRPVALGEVSSELRRALVASEDQRLGRHPGVDPLAIVRAAWANLRAGRVVSGASTIPMQIARLVEPRPRTLVAKCIEALRALQLARRFDADALLALYLDLAPFGGNLEGVAAASAAWFGVAPGELSLAQAALLTTLPRAPAAYDPLRHPEVARRARDRVLDQLASRGVFPVRAVERAKRLPLPTAREDAPFLAPHFARLAVERAAPGFSPVRTTLDARLQRRAEALVTSHARWLRRQGVGNAAVVVLEVPSREVRAMVGSADFFETARPGQVNGALARRAAGSTLKPFLYALAFDRGRLVPDSWLLDLPRDYAGYVPENYDGHYRGRVTAREALTRSLNAPAVAVLADLGLPAFHDLLRDVGFASLDRPTGEYGLPLALGAGEVELLSLTNAYATLAEGGLHRAPQIEPGGAGPAQRLLSPGAAALTLDILAEVERPDLPRSWRLARGAPAVAWKTGTSYGHRDAWAVGTSRDHAIGVWVGNFDGTGREGISGSEHAAPLLFDLFRAVEPEGSALPAPRRERVADTEVCAVSHELPGSFCAARVHVPVLRGSSALPHCTHHRRVFVDTRTGQRLAGDCLARPHRSQIFTLFPAELAGWWRRGGRPLRELPPLHPDCRQLSGGAGPRIVSPERATPYRLRRDAPSAYQRLRLAARTGPGTERLFWYQDGALVGAAGPEERLFVDLARGEHRLVVVDDTGRSHGIHYRVE